MKLAKRVLIDETGYWYAEVYTDDDNASGYGEDARVGRWYGSRAACEAIPANRVKLYPVERDNSPDPFDLACERRFD